VRAEWLGHSAWLIEGKDKIAVDPFLTNNPKASRKSSSVDCDIIVVTHGHFDHFGDTIEIAKKHNATVVAIHEIAVYCESQGVKAEGMNKGGSIKVKNTTIRLVEAIHSSGISGPKGDIIPGGASCGAIIQSGKTIYHAGDTALFSDMKLIGQLYKPDMVMLPTGDRYTMGPKEASWAASYLEAPLTVPQHYGTFPIIDTDPFEFQEHCKKRGLKGEVTILNPGDHINL
jgi:L-ascorbate metabolism protein UlaG (beta-lactamase superfamily)